MSVTFTAESIPNRFDHAEAAPRIYRHWEDGGYFDSNPDPEHKHYSRGPFTMVIPPPNVTGALHLGHALNNTLQDVLIRFKRMQGYNALWMPGSDHAGIATQAVVERRLKEEENLTRHDLGREKLVERIWKWKDQYEARITSQLKQMGCSCDWRRQRFTLDEICARAVRQTFFNMFADGLIYRGKRLVNWDTFLQTAVSDDEVFHEVTKGHFWHFRYPVILPEPGEPIYVTIATTRPETMLGDTAVAVHPDPARALEKLESELAAKLAAAPAKEKDDIEQQLENIRARQSEMLPQLEVLRDMALAGRKLMLPLQERPIPLICDEWARPEMGSGCVKITPAHDPNDYDVWQRHPEIGAINILNADGTLNAEAGKYQGLYMKQARKAVIEDLEKAELVVEIEDREIDLAHSDRSKTPIEPYLADQWFLKMSDHEREPGYVPDPGLAQGAMDAVTEGRVKIHPERYAKSYLDWLGEKRDWCIGRQLWWGHRVPIWWLPDADPVEFDNLLPEVAAGKLAMQTVTDEDTGEKRVLVCVAPDEPELEEQLENAGFVQDDDVLDTWFSSALWPHSTLGWPTNSQDLEYYYPTSVLSTSRDIITLWVARMVIMGQYNMGEVPFKDVFIHPKILDRYGETMSKSKGNGVDPLDLSDKYGPDALRYALAYMTTDTQDVRMPVDYECPHCEAHIEQTKKNRELPVVECPKCKEKFSTQWAAKEEDKALPRGGITSERFEVARNFTNKLWNASRFTLLGLEGYTPGAIDEEELMLEDRWILSRLATVTAEVSKSLEGFHYGDAARTLYGFTWDEFCSFYVEMMKGRLADQAQRPQAQRLLAHVLDTVLRLLHPMIPFITEEVWSLLGRVAPERGLLEPHKTAPAIIVAPWPEGGERWRNAVTEERFATFQAVLGALREIRSRQNIPPKTEMRFAVLCDAAGAGLLDPLRPYFGGMANAIAGEFGPEAPKPTTHAHVSLPELEVYVDLEGLIDKDKERERLTREQGKLAGLITGKEKKLASPNFVDKAPADVVDREREGLARLQEQIASVEEALAALGG